jgi:hypothetical protein
MPERRRRYVRTSGCSGVRTLALLCAPNREAVGEVLWGEHNEAVTSEMA